MPHAPKTLGRALHPLAPAPQRPYLVGGGTLRDQVLYPEPPRAVYAAAGARTRAALEPWMRSLQLGEEELEERRRGGWWWWLCVWLKAGD